MKTKLSVIIPFLNEAENIPFLVKELSEFFLTRTNIDAEVIFVNDGSSDNSLGLLKKEKHTGYKPAIISLSKNFGSHAALRAGIFHAKGDLIMFMYADLQDPLYLVDQLLEKCNSGFDITWAVRNKVQNGSLERFFSRVYSMLMKKYVVSTYPEKGFDIVMFTRKVQEQMNTNIERNSSVFLQLLTFGFKQDTIGYNKSARAHGKSKWTLSKKIKLFIDSFVAFSYFPIRFVTVLGFTFFLIGLVWTAYVIGKKIFVGDVVSGWPSLVAILFLGFGLTNISLGIIAEYLWRTLDVSRNRPVFIIDEIIYLKNEQDK